MSNETKETARLRLPLILATSLVWMTFIYSVNMSVRCGNVRRSITYQNWTSSGQIQPSYEEKRSSYLAACSLTRVEKDSETLMMSILMPLSDTGIIIKIPCHLITARYAIQIPNNNINLFYCKRNVSTLTPSSERAPFPQLLSELPQQEWRRQSQPNRDKPQETVPPSIIQSGVHIRREQRKPKASQTPQHRRRPNGGCGEPSIRIDEVGLNALEAHDDASPEDGGADIGYDPMSVILGRPAVKKETDRHKHTPRNHQWNAELGPADIVVALFQGPIYTVVDRCTDLGAEEETRPERYIIKAANTD